MKISGETLARLKDRLLIRAIPVLLAVAGATMVTAGVWMIFAPAGWIVGGGFAFLFEQRLDMSTTSDGEGRSG